MEGFPMIKIKPPGRPRPGPSLDPNRVTMAEVIDKISSDESLTSTRRRDLSSATRRICELLDRDPSTLPADVSTLRAGVSGLHPAQLGLSPKTLQNLKANTLAAIRHVTGKGSPKAPLTGDWKALADALPSKGLKNGLSRFIRYCDANNIPPDQVSDSTVGDFITAVRNQTFVKDVNDIHRRTCRLWNEAVETSKDWPQIALKVPSFRPPRKSIPLGEFTVAFQADVQAHLDWLAGTDLFCDHPPPKVCKPATVRLRRSHIELAASALVRRGHPIEDLNTLAVLVTVEAVKEILRDYLDGRNDGPSQFHRDLAKTLTLIAHHWVRVDEDHLEALRDLKRRLGPDRAGLTDKNKATLRQFDDAHNTWLLLDLPRLLLKEASKSAPTDVGAAVQAQIALALSILTAAPLRMHNLIGLRLDNHIVRPSGSRGPVHLVIPREETKAGEPIEYVLPKETEQLLTIYLRDFRPRFGGEGSPWLFSTRRGKQKAQATLSQQIKETITKRTGLRMTPHQFRHLAAKFLLDHNPGNFETVRQLLVHRSIKSTTTFYTGLQSLNASRHYDEFMEEKRRALAQAPPRPKGRKRR